jgi:hypothetical protein
MRLAALLLLFATQPALAADQFDLTCQGTRMTKADGPATRYSFRVRIDLGAKQWCMDACEHALPIANVTPAQITLTDEGQLNTRIEINNEVTLDRKTNAFHQLLLQVRPEENYLKINAACTVAPFTALPATPAVP